MSQKSDLYNALKASGKPLTTSYALYTVDQLEAELAFYQVPVVTIEDKTEPEEPAPVTPEEQAIADQYARFDTAQAPVAPAPAQTQRRCRASG